MRCCINDTNHKVIIQPVIQTVQPVIQTVIQPVIQTVQPVPSGIDMLRQYASVSNRNIESYHTVLTRSISITSSPSIHSNESSPTMSNRSISITSSPSHSNESPSPSHQSSPTISNRSISITSSPSHSNESYSHIRALNIISLYNKSQLKNKIKPFSKETIMFHKIIQLEEYK
jgi:hypothetical protein